MQSARLTLTFFPKIAEIRALVEGSPVDVAEVAWAAFLEAIRRVGSYQSVDFGDEALHETIRVMWGGWAAVAESFTMDEEPFRHSEFVKTYRALATRNMGTSAPMPGRVAIENVARGFAAHVPDPVRMLPPPPRPIPPKELTP